jgi:hypothetical protein
MKFLYTASLHFLFMGIFAALAFGCAQVEPKSVVKVVKDSLAKADTIKEITINDYLNSMLADGFDFPAGNTGGQGAYTCVANGKKYEGWYVATRFGELYSLGIHPGVDINGSGGGDTDLGQAVFSVAGGEVVEAKDFDVPWGKIIVIRHKYLENGKFNECFSVYGHLDTMLVKKGQLVNRRQQIGTIGTGNGSYSAHLHFEIRKASMAAYPADYWPGTEGMDLAWIKENYESPFDFIKAHRQLTKPATVPALMLVLKSKYKLYYLSSGKIAKVFEIGLSQNPKGAKETEGDLKMPEGEYFITGKEKGPFGGDYGKYLGNTLMRISYPNSYDALAAYQKKRISKAQLNAITACQKEQTTPPQTTTLGGKIVIHGWAWEWENTHDRNMTWGCICMHNFDIDKFCDEVKLKTKIIIQP